MTLEAWFPPNRWARFVIWFRGWVKRNIIDDYPYEGEM